ncbi:MAG: hypothetical protein MP439_03920 [Ferrimicrobium sp.]|jgi:hypothetical protein|nr:hypothetical protein [Ferrimicrobium sp.]
MTRAPAVDPMNRHARPKRRILILGLTLAVVIVTIIGGLQLAKGRQATSLTATLTHNRSVTVSDSYEPSAASIMHGTFMNLAHQPVALRSYRGHAIMVWFIAGGCASCAISIPAVARELPILGRDHVSVLALGLWGDFGPAKGADASLLAFARSAAQTSFRNRQWTFGLASSGLSRRYDPAGIPDYYLLVNRDGVITYQNTAPVSTMNQLLKAAAKL